MSTARRLATAFVIALVAVTAACGPQAAESPTTSVDATTTSTPASTSIPAAFLGPDSTVAPATPTTFEIVTSCGVDLLWVNDQAWRAVQDEATGEWQRSVPVGWNVDPSAERPTVVVELELVDSATLTATAGQPPLTVTYDADPSVESPPLCD